MSSAASACTTAARTGCPLPDAPAKQTYPRDACGKKEELSLAMGISVGWRDDYYWRIPGQELDITTVPNGKYRLFVKADPQELVP